MNRSKSINWNRFIHQLSKSKYFISLHFSATTLQPAKCWKQTTMQRDEHCLYFVESSLDIRKHSYKLPVDSVVHSRNRMKQCLWWCHCKSNHHQSLPINRNVTLSKAKKNYNDLKWAFTWHESRPPSSAPAQNAPSGTHPSSAVLLQRLLGITGISTIFNCSDILPFSFSVPQPAVLSSGWF